MFGALEDIARERNVVNQVELLSEAMTLLLSCQRTLQASRSAPAQVIDQPEAMQALEDAKGEIPDIETVGGHATLAVVLDTTAEDNERLIGSTAEEEDPSEDDTGIPEVDAEGNNGNIPEGGGPQLAPLPEGTQQSAE